MTTCRDCGYEWMSLTQCHCALCHRQFSGETAFTRHQGADGCLNPHTLTYQSGPKVGRLVFRPSEERYGIVWRFTGVRPTP